MHTRAGLIVLALAVVSVTVDIAAQTAVPPKAPKAPLDPSTLAARRQEAENRPLFASDTALPFTLSADFKTVNKDRNPKSTRTFPATLTSVKADGSTVDIPVRIRTRGHSRRLAQTCSFAPLRIEFDDTRAAGTVFEGHKALKLGTHCRDADLYEQYVPREYAAYRIFNLITPYSFRARLAQAHYVDTATGKVVADRLGIFIEDDDDVAKRMEGRSIDDTKLTFAHVDLNTTTVMTLFQYMIGNTDMSLYEQHNIRVVERMDGLYPVAYDFDYSGLVNARYAVPAKVLSLTSVRDRLYRGPCRTPTQFSPLFDRFRAVRTQVLALYDTLPGMDPGYRKDAQKYITQFYETIDAPSKAKQAFADGCNGRAGM